MKGGSSRCTSPGFYSPILPPRTCRHARGACIQAGQAGAEPRAGAAGARVRRVPSSLPPRGLARSHPGLCPCLLQVLLRMLAHAMLVRHAYMVRVLGFSQLKSLRPKCP